MKTITIVIHLLLFCYLALAQNEPRTEDNFPLSAEQAQQDVRILKSVLGDIHPGLYRFGPKNEFDNNYQEVLNSLQKETPVLELYRKILGIIAKIGCGHTWAQAPDPLDSYLRDKSHGLPFEVGVRNGNLLCSKILIPGVESIAVGDEILGVDNRPARTIIKEFKHLAIADGFSEPGRISWATAKFDFYYTLFYGCSDNYTVTYRDGNGKENSVVLPALSEVEALPTNENRNKNGQKADTSQISEDDNTAYLKISSFSVDDSEFEDNISRIFKKIDSDEISDLILDLRGNRGGKDGLGRFLLSYLLKDGMEEFERTYVRTIEPKFRQFTDVRDEEVAGLSQITTKVSDTLFLLNGDFMDVTISPRQPYFDGRLYVLIDGRTFSTAADVAAILRSETDAVFIGKETGGGYYGNSSGAMVNLTLANSGIKVRIPAVGYETNVERIFPKGSGTRPHHELESDFSARPSGNDDLLEFTYTLIKNKAK